MVNKYWLTITSTRSSYGDVSENDYKIVQSGLISNNLRGSLSNRPFYLINKL